METDALANAAREQGLRVNTWKDGWLKASAPEKPDAVPGRNAVFVQPLAAGEASDHVAEADKTQKRLAKLGIPNARVVLWLPSEHSDAEFEAHEPPSTITMRSVSSRRCTSATLRVRPKKNSPCELHSVRISRGDAILAPVSAANRFDIHRSNSNKHIAFGIGRHRCIGAVLAKVWMQTVLAALLDRFPSLRLAVAPESIGFGSNPLIYLMERLPVRY